MAIPKGILAVERPKNTRVKLNGKKYDVIKRTSVYIDGRRVPKELGKIGEIIDGRYVPNKKTRMSNLNCDIKDYGKVQLCLKDSNDILDDLIEVFGYDDAVRIYVMAVIRSSYQNVTNRDMKFRYETSFLSEIYKKVPLSEKSICDFLELIGRNVNFCKDFMKKRYDMMSEQSIAIVDGMLKDTTGTKSSFVNWSRKSRLKGTEEISLLYAFDSKNGEPIAHKIYPGNMLDNTAFSDFIGTFQLKKCLVMGDKGFVNKDILSKLTDLEIDYLFPVKRNDSKITANNMYDYIGTFKDENDIIEYSKTKVDDSYYYSYRSMSDAANELKGYLTMVDKNNGYDVEKRKEKEIRFGTITFVSNRDMEPLDVYFLYEKRWQIETFFSFYKNIVSLDTVRVQSDLSQIGSEFINFITSIISLRIKKRFIEKELNQKYSYNQLMDYIGQLKKYYDSETKTWCNTKTLKYIEEIATKLELISV